MAQRRADELPGSPAEAPAPAALQYIEPVNANLLCAICSDPFVRPAQAPCGHTFCRACIERALEVHQRCPTCRVALATEDLAPSGRVVTNMVDELRVKCPHASLGCGETPERSLLETHLSGACPYHVVPCRHEGCPQRLQRILMPEHERICPFRLVPCPQCAEQVHVGERERHLRDACGAGMVRCSFCALELVRSALPAHQLDCSLFDLPCECERFGCTAKVTREGMAAHAASCHFMHVKPFLLLHEREMEALRQTNLELRQRIEQLESDVALVQRERSLGIDTDAALRQENEQLRIGMEAVHDELRSFQAAQNSVRMAEAMQLREELDALQALCRVSQMQIMRLTADLQAKQTAKSFGIKEGADGGGRGKGGATDVAGKL